MTTCDRCNTIFPAEYSKFCRKCGQKRPEKDPLVPAPASDICCGTVFPATAKFCNKCGAKRPELALDDCKERSYYPEWSVNFLFFNIGCDGFDVRPQLALGTTVGNFDLQVGLNDIRNGVELMLYGQASVPFDSEGRNLPELHDSINCDTPGFKEVLEQVKLFLSSGGETAANSATAEHVSGGLNQIADKLGINPEGLKGILSGKDLPPDTKMKLEVTVQFSVGLDAQLCLGWANTESYRMFGASGAAAIGVKFGGTLFAGWHTDGTSLRIVVGVSAFVFDYIFPVKVGTEQKLQAEAGAENEEGDKILSQGEA